MALGLLFIGVMLATARPGGGGETSLDDRRGPWVLWAVVIALGVFTIHCMMDFVIAEPGPLTILAVVLGAALGARTPATATTVTPTTTVATPAQQDPRRRVIMGITLAVALAWVLAIALVVIPVADAEGRAHAGDEALRNKRPDLAAGLFRAAYQTVGYNADYAYRSARASLFASAAPEQVKAMLEAAIAAQPTSVVYHLTLAQVELADASSPTSASADAARVQYERALALDPQNVAARLDFARALEEKLARPREAAEQYRLALATNAAYHPDEPKRLKPADVERIEQRIATLRAHDASPPTFAPTTTTSTTTTR
jgi:tetratricopeptide (TPR) repeat protein